MSRTAVYSAIILRNRHSGESNSEVTLLTAEEGIIRATVFGGAKSKLRSHSAPYNSGRVWIYRDKAKDYAKLSDFDVQSWRPGLRELYERTMAAGALAETILSSLGGGGEWRIALQLAISSMDTLENADEELCERILVHFLWRWSDFLGIQPQVKCCSICGNETQESPFWFSSPENGIFCPDCVTGNDICPQDRSLSQGLIKLNPGSRRWLSAVKPLEPSFLYRYSMDSSSFNEAKAFVFTVLAGALGKRLASWEW